MKLVILDFDKTLVDLKVFHNAALKQTMEQVYEEKDCSYEEVDHAGAGKTLKQNILDLCKKRKIDAKKAEANVKDAEKAYGKAFMGALTDSVKDCVLPGVKELLVKLDAKEDIFTAIVTGSIAEVVNNVMQKLDLAKYFNAIISGDHETDRKEMVQSAIQLTELQAKQKFEEIIVIGDSIHDIDSGKAFKATTIGVLTGSHKEEDLKAHEADHIVKDLTDPTVLEVILR